MTFVIVCGGTAGHINPGISIAQELGGRLPEARIVFIGADREMEKRLVTKAGYELINIKMSGIRRGFSPKDIKYNIKTVVNVMSARRKALNILKQINADAVIGTGGYICYPVLKSASKLKIPTFIHESNAAPGMTVKMLSKVADIVMITYPGFESHYRNPERIVVTGTPIRKEFTEAATRDTVIVHDNKKPLVVSFWGSLGAERMNEIMAGFIKENIDKETFRHIHAAGNSMDSLIGALSKLGIESAKPPYADLRDYIDDMPQLIKEADIVLCRAGGITLAELTATSTPAVIIPSPFVPDNVQQINALQLSREGAAVVLSENDCTGEMLYHTVSGLLGDRNKLAEMSRASGALAKPNATSDIVDLILANTDIEIKLSIQDKADGREH